MTDAPTSGVDEVTAAPGAEPSYEKLSKSASPSEVVDRACGVANQMAVDVRTAAHSLILDEQERAAEAIHHIAEALYRTAQSLDHDRLPMAETTRRAAGRIDAIAERVRDAGWPELVAETEAFAHQQPTLFLAGAVALGFAVGRAISDEATSDGVGGDRRQRRQP